MPSAVTVAPAASTAAPTKPRPAQQPRKKRIVRRRGRAPNGIHSDDDIEREVGSDSDFDDDDDDRSSLDSATDDSDTEPASEDAPSNLESSPPAAVVGVAGEPHMNGVTPFFATSSNWSEMVADEAEHGASGLPVIDFTDFDGSAKAPTRRAKKAQKQRKQQQQQSQQQPASEASAAASQQPQAADEAEAEGKQDSTLPPSASLPRKLGQTARQAYQERLESDPSFVPKVGGFWGHDDRLMDKDLRSLSGWWRGKWSGRARGRGFGMRGRGHVEHGHHEASAEDLPPVERQWTHDGFEEMKRKEDRKHHEFQGESSRGGFKGGRGGFAGRGRGSFKNRFATSPTTNGRPLSPAARQNRVWFATKPEYPWSKQSEAFLFFDTGFKARHAKSSIRVKLPGKQEQVVKPSSSGSTNHRPTTVPVESTPDTREFIYTVRLPKPKPKEPAAAPADNAADTTPVAAPTSDEQPTPPIATALPEAPAVGLPNPSVISQLEQLSIQPKSSDPERQALTEEAVLRKPASTSSPDGAEGTSPSDPRPVLPPLQTVFTPPPPPVQQPSPYGSPFTYPQALPPGIALNHQGMPYEVATGRPVYLQPPPPMFNPRPMHYPPPGLPYVPNHLHRAPALSPDYHSHPSSHTPPMNGFVDPSLFSLPRSVRIEIRAPDEPRGSGSSTGSHSNGSAAKSPPHVPSKLRTAATSFEPTRSTEGEFYPSISTASEGGSQGGYDAAAANGAMQHENGAHQQQQQPPPHPPHMGNMMPYNPYAAPYYYPPDQHYGYPPYMDMSQVGQYDMYMDQSQPQGTVYY